MSQVFGLNTISSVEVKGGMFIETDGAYYYIPNNCSDTTNTIIFSHGAGGDAKYYQQFLENNELDAIFAVPKSNLSSYNMDVSMNMLNNDLETLHNELNINNDNVFTVSHSAGGISSIYYMTENIKKHPDIGPQTCVLFDPAQQDKPNAKVLSNLTDEQLRLIGDNHSTIIGFEQYGSDVLGALPNYKEVGEAGANVIVIGMSDMGQYSPGGDAHCGIAIYGFNRGILAYLAGGKSLEEVIGDDNDKIVAYRYNQEIGDFEEVPISEISGYVESAFSSFGNFSYSGNYYEYTSSVAFSDFNDSITNLKSVGDLGDISSDQSYAVLAMNEIRSLIKNSSILSNICNLDCNSTTVVPVCAKDFLYDYFSASLELLNKLEAETQKVVAISNEIEVMDRTLEKEAEELVDSLALDSQTVDSSDTQDSKEEIADGSNL